MASKIAMVFAEAMNNKVVVNVCLGLSFAVLTVRSWNQQRQIQALEEEKDSLAKANKAMKTAMWDWKQQLFAEASATGASAVVPLATLKAIYGEVTARETGDAAQKDPKLPASKFVV